VTYVVKKKDLYVHDVDFGCLERHRFVGEQRYAWRYDCRNAAATSALQVKGRVVRLVPKRNGSQP
jgi:hypothetical protein